MLHIVGRILFAVWLVSASCAAWAQGAPAFLSTMGDVPLAPGLNELPDKGITFDDPAGRIVEAFAAGPMTRDAVTAFYHATLPGLGWTELGPGRYRRDREMLLIEFIGADSGVAVRYLLSPVS
jgi:hypothetical protein